MKKIGSVILITITIIVVGISGFFIFRRDSLEHIQLQSYESIKAQLIDQSTYQDSSDLVTFSYLKKTVWEKYVVTVTIDNATQRLDDLIILVVNGSELETETNRYYPSLGIFDNIGYDLVPPNTTIIEAKEKKGFNFTFQSLEDVEHILIYLQYMNSVGEPQHAFYSLELLED